MDSLTLLTGKNTPKPSHGEVLIKIKAVSLNYRDIAVGSSVPTCRRFGLISRSSSTANTPLNRMSVSSSAHTMNH